MKKYKTNPGVTVEVIKDLSKIDQKYITKRGGEIFINTMEGEYKLKESSYLIKGLTKDDYYPIDNETFHKKYKKLKGNIWTIKSFEIIAFVYKKGDDISKYAKMNDKQEWILPRNLKVSDGDFIVITNNINNCYPVKPEVFNKRYSLVF